VVKERTRELQVAYENLKAASRQALLGLAEAIEAKDPYTKGHCGRTAVYSMALGKAAGLSDVDLEVLEFGAFLHDIGKIGVRDAVLLKPGALDDEEWKIMREHSRLGAQLIDPIRRLHRARDIVLHHHESWCGRGYPFGLAGEAIPLGARIFSPVDAYDAMTSDRPYRVGMSHDEAMSRLRQGAGSQFDPHVVEALLGIDGREWQSVRRAVDGVPALTRVVPSPEART